MTTKGISPHAIRVLKKILSFLAIFTVLVIMLNGWYAFIGPSTNFVGRFHVNPETLLVIALQVIAVNKPGSLK